MINILLILIAVHVLSACGRIRRVAPDLRLNISLPSRTSRPATLTAITSTKSTYDASLFTASGAWATSGLAGGLNGDVHYVLGTGTNNSLTYNITVTETSRIFLWHLITTDSAALNIVIDGGAPVTIPQGAASDGLQMKDVGTLSIGAHTVVISTSDPWPKFAYVDGLLTLPITDKTAGVYQLGWFEETHPHFYKDSNWSSQSTSIVFPYSVSTLSGAGAIYSSTPTARFDAFINAAAGEDLKIWYAKGSGNGIINVTIDGVVKAPIDTYATTTKYHQETSYTVTPGEHLVELTVSASKNAASSGTLVYLDALELSLNGPSDEARALAFMDSIANNVDATTGATRTAYDNTLYNQDNDSGYALMGLGLAVARWNYLSHAQAFKRSIQWFADTVDDEGHWYWGYCKQGDTDCPRSYIVPASNADCKSGYCPSVNGYYTALVPSVTAIKSVDAPQSFPAVGLALYAALFPGDTAFIEAVKPKIISGIDALIRDNYDSSNGFFYSSYQFKSGSWQLFEVQYSAGQCDAFMGLMSAYALTGVESYKKKADYIKNNSNSTFWDSSRNIYSIGIAGPKGGVKVKDTTAYYPFANGFCSWVFGPSLNNSTTALSTMVSWIQGDGYSVLAPGQTDAETNSSSFLMMGLTSLNQNLTARNALAQKIRVEHFRFHPDPNFGNGGVYGDSYRYLYTSTAFWAWMGLTNQASPKNWWK